MRSGGSISHSIAMQFSAPERRQFFFEGASNDVGQALATFLAHFTSGRRTKWRSAP